MLGSSGFYFLLSFNLDSNAMLVVMDHCAKDKTPDRLLEEKPDNIKCFTNIVFWKDKAYVCDLNKRACKKIEEYYKEIFKTA